MLRDFGDGTLGSIYNAIVSCIPPVYRSHTTPLKFARFLHKSVGKTSSDLTIHRTSEGMAYKLLYKTNSGCYNPWPNQSAFRDLYAELCGGQRANSLLDRAYFEYVSVFFSHFEASLLDNHQPLTKAFIDACLYSAAQLPSTDLQSIALVEFHVSLAHHVSPPQGASQGLNRTGLDDKEVSYPKFVGPVVRAEYLLEKYFNKQAIQTNINTQMSVRQGGF